MVLFFTVIVLGIAAIYVFFKWKHSYWHRRGIPQVKPVFLVGNFKDPILGKIIPNQVIVNCYHELKKAGCKHGGIYFMYTPLWIPIDLGLIKQILFKDFWNFAAHGLFYKHKDDILSNNLFSSEEEDWKNLRSKLSPAFSSGKLKLMFEILDALGDRLEKKVSELSLKSKPLDIKELAACFGTDVIACCAFGLECNSLENPDTDFRKYGKMIFKPQFFTDIIQMLVNWDLLNFLGHTWMRKDVNRFFLDLSRKMIKYRENHDINRPDFLNLLLQLKKKGNGKDCDEKEALTFEEIVGNIFIMYAAGFETTSTTISFMMYELAKHPDIQEKVRQEIRRICKDRPLTYDDLLEMKYSEMVINETLRIHSVATEVPRKCTADYKIPGTDITIEKGTFVLVPSWAIQTDPEYYPNPQEFNPENFSEESKAARNVLAFYAFGEGPRQCIGYRFAMIQMKLALVKLLNSFKYELNANTPTEITYDANSITIQPKGDVLLDIISVVNKI